MQSLPPSLERSAASAPMRDAPAIIEMERVSRHYGDLVAVHDVTLAVPQGTILGLIGPSGSGKTTIIRMLTGTLGPTSGRLSVLGQVPLRFTRQGILAPVVGMPSGVGRCDVVPAEFRAGAGEQHDVMAPRE